jgi:hypothetical protein
MPMADRTKVKWITATTATIWMFSKLRPLPQVRLQRMNARNGDDGEGELQLEVVGVDMVQPVRLFRDLVVKMSVVTKSDTPASATTQTSCATIVMSTSSSTL